MKRDVSPILKDPMYGQPKKRRGLRAVSPKRAGEKEIRKAFVAAVLEHYHYECQGPARGLPGPCARYDFDRDALDVHEPDQRSTHPGSHVRSTLAVPLCHAHHAYVTSPSGEALEIVRAAGLIVRATS